MRRGVACTCGTPSNADGAALGAGEAIFLPHFGEHGVRRLGLRRRRPDPLRRFGRALQGVEHRERHAELPVVPRHAGELVLDGEDQDHAVLGGVGGQLAARLGHALGQHRVLQHDGLDAARGRVAIQQLCELCLGDPAERIGHG